MIFSGTPCKKRILNQNAKFCREKLTEWGTSYKLIWKEEEDIPEVLILEDVLCELWGGDPDEIHKKEYEQTRNKPPQPSNRTAQAQVCEWLLSRSL